MMAPEGKVNLILVLEEKSEEHKSQSASSSEHHECLYKISWQSIQ